MSYYMKAFFISCFCFFSLLFVFISPAFAVSVNVVNAPTSISSDAFSVSVNVTGASAGTNYLRVDLYKDGTTNYFGETFNGQSWYASSDGTQYYLVTIGDDKSGNATIQARIGNPTAHDYDGTGIYKLRVRRYTSSGNPASGDDMSSVQVAIIFPTITDTPAPTPTPTKIPTPTPTARVPTATPSQKVPATATIKPAPTVHVSSATTNTPTKMISVTSSIASSGVVLGTSSSTLHLNISPTFIPSPTKKLEKVLVASAKASWNGYMVAGIAIIGVILMGCGILLFWKRRREASD